MKKIIDRRERIIELLDTKGTITIEELEKEFGVSDMTIYRDLQKLEKEGYLRKMIGGAIRNYDYNVGVESSYTRRLKLNWEEKQAIARKTLEYIENGDSILLDGSTTTFALAREIRKSQLTNLIVITTHLNSQLELLKNEKIKVISTGGELSPSTISMVGPITERYLERINVDKMFMSVKGVSLDGDLLEADIYMARVKELFIQCSNECTLLADHSKFGKNALNKIASVKSMKRIISSKLIPQIYLDQLLASSVELQLVDF
ncbi:MAG: DeoR/GlpR family DNA-binding transcription regulator [Actinobacteria bacterium]|nr:DeoR/GlpR family DNA-binding transcription regulator [Actinomycetota bacterium]